MQTRWVGQAYGKVWAKRKISTLLLPYPLKSIWYKIKLANTRLKVASHVFIDEHLSWTCHINNLSTTLSRINGILSKLRHFAPITSLIAVYYALFYSKLLYGSPIWYLASSTNLNTIKVLQKKMHSYHQLFPVQHPH